MDYNDNPIKIRKPRTIDRLEIQDCVEIIMRDLERYGVPGDTILDVLSDYFVPLRNKTNELKKKYGDICYANSPDHTFFW